MFPGLQTRRNKSYIDAQPHESCGVIARIPLYHPLAYCTDKDDFITTSANLVLGGGRERSGAVANLLQCIYFFPGNYEFDQDAYEPPFARDYKNGERLLEILELSAEEFSVTVDALHRIDGDYSAEPANFSSWGSVAWVDFHAVAQRTQWGRPFDPTSDQLERWIAEVVGEYALVNMQDVLAELAPSRPRTSPSSVVL